MGVKAGPQLLWLPQDVNGVQFTGEVKVEGDWDVLAGGWKSLHRVTRGKGMRASSEMTRIVRETGGRFSMVFAAPVDFTKTTCLIGTKDGQPSVKLCLRAVEGGRGGAPF